MPTVRTVSDIPVLNLDASTVAGIFTAGQTGSTLNFKITFRFRAIVGGGYTTQSYGLPLGFDISTEFAEIAASLPIDIPGVFVSLVGPAMKVADISGTYDEIRASFSHITQISPPISFSLGDFIFSENQAFIDPAASQKIISRGPGPWSAAPQVLSLACPVVETSPSGWDIMRERLWVPYSPYFAAGERRDMMLDERAQPFAHMLAQEERVVDFKGGFPVIELLSLGFAREKAWTIQTTQDSQGEVGSVGGVIRNLPTFTLTWFSETLEDTKTVIPSPAVPPETFGWDAVSITSGLPNNVGFILIKRDVDPLPVINGSTPQAQAVSGGVTRANANLHPRPTLCKVVDYYVLDFTDATPPGD